VRTAGELGLANLPDDELFQKAKRLQRTVLTNGPDFWSDSKFPLRLGGGAVVLDGGGSGDTGASLSAFFLLYEAFARSFGGRWRGVRVKASTERLLVRVPGEQGKPVIYEIAVLKGIFSAREYRGFD
jgi:hypothetical protein